MPAPALAARGHCPGPGAPPPTRDDVAARGQVPARGRARARWPRQTRPGEAARAHAGVDVPQYRAGAVASLRRSVAALAAAIVRAPTGAAAPHPRRRPARGRPGARSEEHTSELQSLAYLVCRLLLEKKKLASSPLQV